VDPHHLWIQCLSEAIASALSCPYHRPGAKLLHLYSWSFSFSIHGWPEVNSSVTPTLNASHFHLFFPALLPIKDIGIGFGRQAQEICVLTHCWTSIGTEVFGKYCMVIDL
jgi:hypothetical protein